MHLLLLRFANKKFLLPILGVFILAILFFPRSADAIVWLPIIAGLAIASYFFGDDLLNAAAKPLGDVKPLATALLDKFGSFGKVLHATPTELLRVEGVNEAAVVAIKVTRHAAERLLKEEISARPVV